MTLTCRRCSSYSVPSGTFGPSPLSFRPEGRVGGLTLLTPFPLSPGRQQRHQLRVLLQAVASGVTTSGPHAPAGRAQHAECTPGLQAAASMRWADRQRSKEQRVRAAAANDYKAATAGTAAAGVSTCSRCKDEDRCCCCDEASRLLCFRYDRQ
jgi:hypothetical protein